MLCCHGCVHVCVFVCLQGLRVGGALSLSQARKVNVEPGCSVPDPCATGPCPANSYCSDDWDSYSCTCLAGQSAHMCRKRMTAALCSYESITSTISLRILIKNVKYSNNVSTSCLPLIWLLVTV